MEAQARVLETAFKELKMKNEEIIAAQQKLIVQDKLATLGQLMAGIAHEIKNPLNFVNNFSEVLVELIQELREELHAQNGAIAKADLENIEAILGDIDQNANTINESGQRAIRIITNLLEQSRGNDEAFRPTDINSLLDENVKLAYHGFRALNPSFNVAIEKDFAPDLPKINLIPTDLGRVLLNILNNACYALNEKAKAFTNDFAPKISVTSRAAENQVVIRIRDNGPGIPPEVREQIFKPFFTTKPSGEGNTGLGLSISREIVEEKHYGKLEVYSEEGKYTEFCIALPVNGLK